jgi:tetratricopeptide (TPR) repeat protein
MSRYPLIVLYFCLLAIITIIFLRPDPNVRFEAETARLAPEDALSLLKDDPQRAAGSRNLMLAKAELAAQSGDFKLARKSLSQLALIDPSTPAPRDALADVARISGDLKSAARHLEMAQRIRPRPDRRIQLANLYRQLHDTEKERRTLNSVSPEDLTAPERQRLMQLMVLGGEFETLEDMLETLSLLPPTEAEPYRTRLVDLLIEDGRTEQAIQSIAAWFMLDERQQAVLVAMVPSLIEHGLADQAHRLALMSMQQTPEDGHILLPFFARTGHGAEFRSLQDIWLEAGIPLTDEGWNTLIRLAETTGELRGLRQAFARAEIKSMEASLIGDALMQFLRYQGARALEPYREVMSENVLRTTPLLGAAWMADQRRPQEALDYLLQAAQSPLTEWDQQIWLRSAQQLQGSPVYAALLQGDWSDDPLRVSLRQALSPEVTVRPEP